MSRPRFAIAREDGRSDARVIADLVAGETAGRLFEYAELKAALEVGTSKVYDRARISSSVRRANGPLLKRHRCMLQAVAGEGYRLAFARDHLALAVRQERSAERRLGSALKILQNTDMGQLNDTERKLHESHLLVTGAVIAQVMSITRRQRRTEAAIANLFTRVDALEAAKAG